MSDHRLAAGLRRVRLITAAFGRPGIDHRADDRDRDRPLAAGDPARYATLAATLALVIGGICVLGWVARLGVLADLLSRPVLVGYMAGIAVIMIVSQLGKIGRIPVHGESVLAELRSLTDQLPHMHLPTLILAAGVLAFLLITTRLLPRWPVPLLGVLLATGVTAAFSLREHGIQVVGDIPAGFPVPALPSVSASDLAALQLPAIGVAVVGCNDNVLTARAFAIRASHRVDANAELLALGTANLASGLLRGFPVSSSGSRTAIGDALGSRSQLHSLVALAAVVLTLLVGPPGPGPVPQRRTRRARDLRRAAAHRTDRVPSDRHVPPQRAGTGPATMLAVLLLGVLYGILAASHCPSWTCCAG